MAKRTFLQMVQDATAELSLPSPTTVSGNADDQVRQLMALANREGREVSKMGAINDGWPQLRKEYTLTFSIGEDNYPFPSDLGYLIPQTGWDRSFRWQLLGPLSAQEWQVLKSGISPTGPRVRYRIMANRIYFDPAPYSADQIVFEYYSNSWCLSTNGTGQDRWMADSDTYALDDDTMTLGIIWRFKAAKGLAYDYDKRIYDDAVARARTDAGSSRSLPLNARAGGLHLLNNSNVPDTGFGS